MHVTPLGVMNCDEWGSVKIGFGFLYRVSRLNLVYTRVPIFFPAHLLVLNSRPDFAAVLGREVDDNAARFHGVNHLLGDHKRSLPSGDEGGGDDDVDFLALIGEETGCGSVPLGGHFYGAEVN